MLTIVGRYLVSGDTYCTGTRHVYLSTVTSHLHYTELYWAAHSYTSSIQLHRGIHGYTNLSRRMKVTLSSPHYQRDTLWRLREAIQFAASLWWGQPPRVCEVVGSIPTWHSDMLSSCRLVSCLGRFLSTKGALRYALRFRLRPFRALLTCATCRASVVRSEAEVVKLPRPSSSSTGNCSSVRLNCNEWNCTAFKRNNT